ncbi:uncharacterized protein LOC143352461 [Halictus rubicundus]|uniref:uncharacterized protein LOC143352461 n=1 Tax=Halictus rubicundus TaxID=77578 RepID=UPI0040360980
MNCPQLINQKGLQETFPDPGEAKNLGLTKGFSKRPLSSTTSNTSHGISEKPKKVHSTVFFNITSGNDLADANFSNPISAKRSVVPVKKKKKLRSLVKWLALRQWMNWTKLWIQLGIFLVNILIHISYDTINTKNFYQKPRVIQTLFNWPTPSLTTYLNL